MATLLILAIFFWPIGDCINRVPLYYLFDEKKLKNIYVFILQSKMEDGGNIIM